MGTTQEVLKLFGTNHENDTPQNNSYTATYLQTQKISNYINQYLPEKPGRTHK